MYNLYIINYHHILLILTKTEHWYVHELEHEIAVGLKNSRIRFVVHGRAVLHKTKTG